MSSNSDKTKAKKWSGGLKLMGSCFNSNDPSHKLLLHDQQENQQQQNVHQNQHTHHHSARKVPGVPKKGQRTTKSSNEEDGKGQHKIQSNARIGNQMHIVKNVKELREGFLAYENVDVFKFEELKLATKHFRPDLIVGEGGFGTVYKGVLDESIRPKYKPQIHVAIKQLNPNGFQGDREWLVLLYLHIKTEVNYLGQLSYPNLVKLIGYCCDGEQRLLVYEYMASGSLERHLFRRSSTTMTWLRRIKAALDAAKGLAYLHGLEQPIIYRDLKTANVLLDENFDAKLSDFGLAKEGPRHLTAMSDVYSFGAVLLELLIGRRVLEKGRSNREHNLVEVCRPALNNSKKLSRILDLRIDGQYSNKAMIRVANLAYQCLSSNPKVRPAMRQVVQILETIYDQESSPTNTLFDKKSNETPKVEEKMKSVEEERQPREHRVRRGERSRSEPQGDYHTFNRNAVDVMSPNLSEMRNV
ncbi:hypothetical protein V2J09_011289 [Rumex salicifolius]